MINSSPDSRYNYYDFTGKDCPPESKIDIKYVYYDGQDHFWEIHYKDIAGNDHWSSSNKYSSVIKLMDRYIKNRKNWDLNKGM